MSTFLNAIFANDSEEEDDAYEYHSDGDAPSDDEEQEEPTPINLLDLAKKPATKTKTKLAPTNSKKPPKKQEEQWSLNNQKDPLTYVAKRRQKKIQDEKENLLKKTALQQQTHDKEQHLIKMKSVIFKPPKPSIPKRNYGIKSLYEYMKLEFEKQFKSDNPEFTTYDLTLVCLNGLSIGAHAYFLSARSRYFRNLIENNSENNSVIHITDLSYEALLHYLEALYGMRMDHVNTNEMEQLLAVLKLDESEEKFRNARLFYQKSRHSDLETDLARFFSKDMIRNGTNGTDLIIRLIDPLDEQHTIAVYHAHKFIMCRSNFVQSMFKAGMEEAQCGIVRLSDVSPAAFEKFLTYMYTNVIQISEMDAVELLNLSLIMELTELYELSRDMIIHLIDEDNVFSILSLLILMRDEKVALQCRDTILMSLNKDNAYEWAMMQLMDGDQHIMERCASLLALQELSEEMVHQLPVDTRVALNRIKLENSKKQSRDAIKKRVKEKAAQIL